MPTLQSTGLSTGLAADESIESAFFAVLARHDPERAPDLEEFLPFARANDADRQRFDKKKKALNAITDPRFDHFVASGRYPSADLILASAQDHAVAMEVLGVRTISLDIDLATEGGRDHSESWHVDSVQPALVASPPVASANADIPVAEQVVDRPTEQGPGGSPPVCCGSKTNRKRIRTNRAEANQQALKILAVQRRRHPAKKMTTRCLAQRIGCSPSLICKLSAWITYEAEWKRRGLGSRRATTLSDAVLATNGRDDDQLEELIAEQTADFEASPLISTARKNRRRKIV